MVTICSVCFCPHLSSPVTPSLLLHLIQMENIPLSPMKIICVTILKKEETEEQKFYFPFMANDCSYISKSFHFTNWWILTQPWKLGSLMLVDMWPAVVRIRPHQTLHNVQFSNQLKSEQILKNGFGCIPHLLQLTMVN